MKKQVSATMKDILGDDGMKMVMDPSADVIELAEELQKAFSYDLYSRKPGPALVDGEFVGTDLDLACFMSALAQRGAVIAIPEYESRRVASARKTNEVNMGGKRIGKILKMQSNKEVFSFSVSIKDQSVLITNPDGSQTTGAPRTFMLMDVTGDWYDGWRSVEFVPSAKENDFLSNNKLWTDSKVVFKNFVHPNRWISFYGKPYFLLKAVIQRLESEMRDINVQIKAMVASGIKYPEGPGHQETFEYESPAPQESKVITVESLEAEVDIPEFEKFRVYKQTKEELVRLSDLRRKVVYTTLPNLRFISRTIEFAFYRHGVSEGKEKFPGWIKNASWERGFKFPRKRIEWNRLVLTQPGVGKLGISIRYRIITKNEKVAK